MKTEDVRSVSVDRIVAASQREVTRWFLEHGRKEDDREVINNALGYNGSALPDRTSNLLAAVRRQGLASLSGRSVLDIGCGYGGISACLAVMEDPAQVAALDCNEGFLKVFQRILAENPLEIRLVRADMNCLPFARPEFDCVIVNDCFIFKSIDKKSALGQIRDILKGGGVVVFKVANAWYPKRERHSDYDFPNPWSLRRMLKKAGFRQVTYTPANGFRLAQKVPFWKKYMTSFFYMTAAK